MKEYKLMLTVPEENILWDIVEEKVQTSCLCYSYLSKYIDLEKWKLSFFSLYRRWVEEDDYSIYDINNDVNISIINALVEPLLFKMKLMVFILFNAIVVGSTLTITLVFSMKV